MNYRKLACRFAVAVAAFEILLLVLFAGTVIVRGAAPQDTRAQSAAPTFSADVAPILYNRCVSCHRPGEVAPMSLITYRDVRPWATAIKQKVTTRTMPPWTADPHVGKFRNDPSLSDREIETITRWADGGAREGDPTRMPALPKFAEGWQIGKPDAVFEMAQEYQIAASGAIDYQYFEVPTNFTEDRWVQAGEVRAGDRSHVHHVIVYVREGKRIERPNVMSIRPIVTAGTPPLDLSRLAAAAGAARGGGAGNGRAVTPQASDNMLVNWAVGEDAPVYLPGMAKRIPAGSSLIFQVHYTTNGKPGVDCSKIGLIFSKEPPSREIRTGAIANPMFAIPAGADNHIVESEASFSDDVKVWTMHPHMHYRGKDMTYTAIYPDGRQEVVLRVPEYDFGWQADYWLKEPLVLPKGSKLHVTAHFDNSTANKANPDATATVRWGDQTWEEMMIGFITYTVEGKAASVTTAGQ